VSDQAGPRVGIIMGSDSDLPVMRDAASVLDTLGVAFELTIVSAHRTPDRMVDYARSAADRGLSVIIAGAGGAAHAYEKKPQSFVSCAIFAWPISVNCLTESMSYSTKASFMSLHNIT